MHTVFTSVPSMDLYICYCNFEHIKTFSVQVGIPFSTQLLWLFNVNERYVLTSDLACLPTVLLTPDTQEVVMGLPCARS